MRFEEELLFVVEYSVAVVAAAYTMQNAVTEEECIANINTALLFLDTVEECPYVCFFYCLAWIFILVFFCFPLCLFHLTVLSQPQARLGCVQHLPWRL